MESLIAHSMVFCLSCNASHECYVRWNAKESRSLILSMH